MTWYFIAGGVLIAVVAYRYGKGRRRARCPMQEQRLQTLVPKYDDL